MTNDTIRQHCLSLPYATEVVQWEDHLLFKVGGKMFAIIELDGHRCSLKCSPEKYAELVEMEDIVPTDHNMWKYNWVTLETLSALPDRDFRELLTASYDIVRAGLSNKVRADLDAGREATPRPRSRTGAGKRAFATRRR